MRKIFVLAALATVAFSSLAVAASTDPSRSDSGGNVVVYQDLKPGGTKHPGDTASNRSASRSDSAGFTGGSAGAAPNGEHWAGNPAFWRTCSSGVSNLDCGAFLDAGSGQ